MRPAEPAPEGLQRPRIEVDVQRTRVRTEGELRREIDRRGPERRDRLEDRAQPRARAIPIPGIAEAGDAAEGILLATERYDKSDPVNLGSSFEISLKDLAVKVARATGFEGEIVWDTSMPNGQPRRKLDVSRAEREFGFKAKTDFDAGLEKTVQWYKEKYGIR